MHPIASAGNPAFTPASRIALTVSLIQRDAEGCGESTIALRDLTAIRILKIAVDVGLVDGIIAGHHAARTGHLDDIFVF